MKIPITIPTIIDMTVATIIDSSRFWWYSLFGAVGGNVSRK